MGDFIVMPTHVHLLAAFANVAFRSANVADVPCRHFRGAKGDIPTMAEQCDSWLHYTARRINQAIGERGNSGSKSRSTTSFAALSNTTTCGGISPIIRTRRA